MLTCQSPPCHSQVTSEQVTASQCKAHPAALNIWGALAGASLRGGCGAMGTGGKKESPSNVRNARYPRTAGPAALQLCHSGTLWQNALLQLAAAPEGTRPGGPRPGGSPPEGTLAPHAHRDWCRGLNRERSPPGGHASPPRRVPPMIPGSAHPARTPPGMELESWPASLATARLFPWGSLVAPVCPGGSAGMCGGLGVCLCLWVLVFSWRSRPRVTERALCLPAPACHGSRRFPATLHGAQPLRQELSRNFNAAD